MISLNYLAKKLNDGLNTALGTSLNTDTDVFQFRIFPDTANYKRPTREANTVTHYIHGILSEINSTVEDTSASTVFGVLNTRLALIIPIVDEKTDYMEMVGDIRNILDGYFSHNTYGTLTNSGKTYSYSANYSFSQSGTRQQDHIFGDCFRFYVYINYYLIESGLNSRAFKIYYNNVEMPYQTLNISRNSIMEGNVPSNTTNSASKNVISSTQLVVKVTMPMGTDTVSNYLLAYLLDGDITARPLKISKTVGTTTIDKVYNVVISDTNASLESIMNGGFSITFAEKL